MCGLASVLWVLGSYRNLIEVEYKIEDNAMPNIFRASIWISLVKSFTLFVSATKLLKTLFISLKPLTIIKGFYNVTECSGADRIPSNLIVTKLLKTPASRRVRSQCSVWLCYYLRSRRITTTPSHFLSWTKPQNHPLVQRPNHYKLHCIILPRLPEVPNQ